MIKKLLLIPIAIFILKIASFGQACTPDPIYTTNGVHPDSATGFDTAYVGIAYTQLVTIIIPKDTTPIFPPIALTWDSTILVSISGMPASMSYACWNNSTNPNRCSWKGNTKGCAIITGTPTAGEVGTHALLFKTDN